jgi:Kef-type K+ transport system membrane component KefB
MNFLQHLELPFKNPVIIFAIVLFVILLSPIILKKFKIPSLVGLIISGMILGPKGFYILERDSSIILFGTVGLLYIMFLAGLELDFNIFQKNKNKSLVFGFLTFIIPLSIGYIICKFIFQFSELTSLLVASMFSTHTLVSYPIVSRLGILKKDVVGIAVGGTIFTDTAVLILFAIIIKMYVGELNTFFWLKLLIGSSLFVFIVYYLFPKLTKWFFKNIEPESIWQYIFILALLFTSAFLAEIVGLEPIIGAFLAGLSLNKLIPHNSALMDKIDFVGNAIFIPFFLISVGMIIDLSVLTNGTESIIFALTLSLIALITKWIAAYFTGNIYSYNKNNINLLFGLSASHAAATLAIIIVAFNIGLVNEAILNGTIILILITCITSSFFTENYGRKIALSEDISKDETFIHKQRIMVPVSNPENIKNLIELGLYLKESNSTEMIYPLMVLENEEEIIEKTTKCRNIIDQTIKQVSPNLYNKIQLAIRLDISPSSGIIRAVKELMITDLVIGISKKHILSDFLFGNIAENIVNELNQNIYIAKIVHPLNTTEKIFVFIPEYSELEIGFENVIISLCRLSNNTGSIIAFCCNNKTYLYIRNIIKANKLIVTASFEIFQNLNDLNKFIEWIQEDDLIAIIHSRNKGISFNNEFNNFVNDISNNLVNNNFLLILPEQNPIVKTEDYTKFDILDSSAVKESLNLIEKITNFFQKKK